MNAVLPAASMPCMTPIDASDLTVQDSSSTGNVSEEQLLRRVDSMSETQLDQLPLGTIQLDANGNILKYNNYEERLARTRKINVVGKNFFTEVAPCTNVQEFFGRFKKGVQARNMHEKFRYHFSFKHNPLDVTITLFYSDITETIWVFVRPLDSSR